MKKLLVPLAAAFISTSALANTCANPIPIYSDSVVTGNTCDAPNSLPGYGGIPSPQNDIVYSFVAEGANATITLEHTGAAFGATMFVMPSPCSSSTDPTNLGDFTTPMVVDGLTDGETYYVIVTADPGGPDDACGEFSATVNGVLPVELQSFSVD